MAKEKNANSSKPAQVTVILRLIAGGYLVYLAYGLLQEYLKPTGGGQLIQIGAAVVFFGFGGVIGGWSLMKFAKGDYIRYGQVPEDEEDMGAETSVEPEAERGMNPEASGDSEAENDPG